MTTCNCLVGTLLVPVVNGYAKFTDLRITTALRRMRLIFFSSNGLHNFSAAAFAVRPTLFVRKNIRQQPIIAQAGEHIVFELGLLDSSNFLSELNFETSLNVQLVSSVPGGAVISCGAHDCRVATSRAGYVRFSFFINQTSINFVLSF